MAERYMAFETCARCGGRFPGPGIGWHGKVYCCDQCAVQAERSISKAGMLLKMLPIAALAVGVGTMFYRYGRAAEGRRIADLIGATAMVRGRLSAVSEAASKAIDFIRERMPGYEKLERLEPTRVKKMAEAYIR